MSFKNNSFPVAPLFLKRARHFLEIATQTGINGAFDGALFFSQTITHLVHEYLQQHFKICAGSMPKWTNAKHFILIYTTVHMHAHLHSIFPTWNAIQLKMCVPGKISHLTQLFIKGQWKTIAATVLFIGGMVTVSQTTESLRWLSLQQIYRQLNSSNNSCN